VTFVGRRGRIAAHLLRVIAEVDLRGITEDRAGVEKEKIKELAFMKSVHCVFVGFLLLISDPFRLSQEVTAKHGNELHKSQIIGPRTIPFVPELETISHTPQRLARGKYLVEGLLQCPFCHSEIDFKKRPVQPLPGTKGGGGHVFDRTQVFGPGNRIVASNITSDPEYGAGKWEDGDFVRALRQGIGHDRRTLFPLMPYKYFRNLSDEDLASVVV
jgi:hypothetical protein